MATSNNMATVLLQNDTLNSLWIPSSSPPFPGGSTSMVMSFENAGSDATEKEEPDDQNEDDYDGASLHAPSKKRRLTARQVENLEKSFEVENKLEPERKAQLASELGLQPRQVAIWFQNRRARYKTKQLEKDFAVLRASFDALKSDYDHLLQHNHDLKLQVESLKEKLSDEPRNDGAAKATVVCKVEDASSAKSDVLDCDESPHCAEDNNYYSSEAAEQSDEEAGVSPPPPQCQFLPKLEDCCYDDPPGSSCHDLGFAVEEDQPFNFWLY